MSQSQDQSTSFSPMVVVPTFNNAATLGSVLEPLLSIGFPVIVVDDGCTDRTPSVLAMFPTITIITHTSNQGKAAGLRSGFAKARSLGATHAVTIDSDGQHDPLSIPDLLDISRQHPAALIIGARDPHTQGYPVLSKLGRRASNILIRLESGAELRDSQCGLRVYPLDFIAATACRAGHYGFETEILTRAAWSGREIVQADVACRYFPPSQRVSHFRPLTDSLRAINMHWRLALVSPRYAFRRFTARYRPRKVWNQLRNEPSARRGFAGGLALGVFIACLPIFGLQGILSLLVARWLKFNPLSAVVGSQVSTPPLGVAVIFISVASGHLMLHGSWPDAALWQSIHNSFHPLSLFKTLFVEWAVGGIVVGTLLSLLTYIATRTTLSLSQKRA